ncbi:hypothetical protein [Teredinibacter haidensis]|uniref:hypothetical protein n=1 Tax=Teredinibacter haidensis TaxID=2731755 RepID=UPI000948A26D|nr:hypothetical protein [Teredinibacter haidensis]
MSTAKTTAHDARFNLLLTGEILDGYDTAQVQSWLAQTLKVPYSTAGTLLIGTSKCLKKQLSKIDATKYRHLFESHGVGIRLQQIQSPVKKAINDQPPIAPAKDQTAPLSTSFLRVPVSSQPSVALQFSAILSSLLALLTTSLGYMLACFLLLWFTTNRILALILDSDSSTTAIIVFHIIPALVATACLLMLLRIVFARATAPPGKCLIDNNEQAKLLQFIREIYELLGAEPPTQIYLNHDVRCSSTYSCDLAHPLSGHRELTIGVPLFTALNSRQLAGLIAHEAARLKHPAKALIQSAHHWLYQQLLSVSEHTDNWSQLAETKAHGAESRIQHLSAYLMIQALHASSVILRPFSLLYKISGRYATQLQTLVADHYATSLIGSRELAETFTQIHVTNHCFHQAYEKVFGSLGVVHLVDNLPALTKHFVTNIDQKALKLLADEVNQGRTRKQHDYPTDRTRIIAAEDLDLSGTESQNLPASDLLEKSHALFRQATRVYYQNQDLTFSTADLVDVKKLSSLAQKDQLRDQLSTHYFNQWFNSHSYWRIPPPEQIKNLNKAERIALLNENIARIRHATPDYLQLIESEESKEEEFVHFSAANEIRKAGYRFTPEELKLLPQQIEHFQTHYNKVKFNYQSRQKRMQRFFELMGTRLFLGIALHPQAVQRQRGVSLLQMLVSLHNHHQRLHSLRIRVGSLPILIARISGKKETALLKKVNRVTRDIGDFCASALATFDNHHWGFQDDFTTLAQFVQAHVKQEFDHENAQPLESIDYYCEITHGMNEANRMINNQLALIARDAEQANNITPVRLTS